MKRHPSHSRCAGRVRAETVLVVLLLGVVGWLLFKDARTWFDDVHYEGAESRPVMARGELADDETTTIELFQAVGPSVVYITGMTIHKDCFHCRALEIPQGTGTGFVWDENGYIVTNYHVIADSESIQVALADQSVWKGRIVGSDPDNDIAVLKVDAPRRLLPPIPLGTSTDLRVGQKVFAIGNPFGFDQTLTTGIISGLGREITGATNRPIRGMIQTDAAINPGNSGGPLLDSAGRVIGVNAAILSPSGAYAGMGFAVPIDAVNRIVPQLIRGEQIDRPRLGVLLAEDYLVQRLGREGAMVLTVTPGSAADKAGLLAARRNDDGEILLGDLIVAIDGEPVNGTGDLFRIIDSHKVGDKAILTIVREDEKLDVEITLENLP
jgi:S1-C subfamily serine protease